MINTLNVAVLGGGSFGTAMANIAGAKGHCVHLWIRDAELAAVCQSERENKRYLPGYTLPDQVQVSADLSQCVNNADVVFVAVPSSAFREVTKAIAPLLKSDAVVISSAKGIEPDGFHLMSDILQQELGTAFIGVLSGPNFATELMSHHYTGSVVAAREERVIDVAKTALSSPTYRIYRSHDVKGVELGGALKNIYAIICGLAAAMGTGNNTQAMILTRSLAEMSRFAQHWGAQASTFLGLAGVGDLVLTCTSDQSRNYRVGYALGCGRSLQEAQADLGQVVEGINTLKIVKFKADELGVYMPLVQALYAIIFEQHDVASVVKGLMTGEMTNDVDLQGGL